MADVAAVRIELSCPPSPRLRLSSVLIVVQASSATVLSRQSGQAGLDLEHAPLRLVHVGPGGGDSAHQPAGAGC
jgi:hypothetical protein